MVRVRWGDKSNVVVKITEIDDGQYIVNNRIELHTWKDINDGN